MSIHLSEFRVKTFIIKIKDKNIFEGRYIGHFYRKINFRNSYSCLNNLKKNIQL